MTTLTLSMIAIYIVTYYLIVPHNEPNLPVLLFHVLTRMYTVSPSNVSHDNHT